MSNLIKELEYWLRVIGTRAGEDRCFNETVEDVIAALRAHAPCTRTAIIEECAKIADTCKIRAEQTYGVAEGVGAHMAARSIRRLATLATSSDGGVEALRHAASRKVPAGVTSGSDGVAAIPSDTRSAASTVEPVALQVWYGSMPESNGKSNFTAILHKGDLVDGHTIARSEYPDRVRYEADRVRFLLGELPENPDILAYDADKHSGYAAPTTSPEPATCKESLQVRSADAVREALPLDWKPFNKLGPRPDLMADTVIGRYTIKMPYVHEIFVYREYYDPESKIRSWAPITNDQIGKISTGGPIDWDDKFEEGKRIAQADYQHHLFAALSAPVAGAWQEETLWRRLDLGDGHHGYDQVVAFVPRHERVTSQPDTDAVTIVAPPIPPLLQREWMAQALFEVDAPDHLEWADAGLDKRERYLALADTAIAKAAVLTGSPRNEREGGAT